MKNLVKYFTTPAYAEVFEEILSPLKLEDLQKMKKVSPEHTGPDWIRFVQKTKKINFQPLANQSLNIIVNIMEHSYSCIIDAFLEF